MFFSQTCLKSPKIAFPCPEKQYIVLNIAILEKISDYLQIFFERILSIHSRKPKNPVSTINSCVKMACQVDYNRLSAGYKVVWWPA